MSIPGSLVNIAQGGEVSSSDHPELLPLSDGLASVTLRSTATLHHESTSILSAASSDLSPYIYTPLGPGEIRLLYVEKIDNELIWSLNTVQLQTGDHTSLEFDALSYCWGDLSEKFPFVCNGKVLHLHKNLHDALPYLAMRNSNLPIWIDAVCINQADEAEKLLQISRMGRIYRQANQVWVWMGPHMAETSEAIALFPHLIKAGETIQERGIEFQDFSGMTPAKVGLPELSSPVWDAIRQITHNPWFGRLWVVQEASLAKNIKVLCGIYEIDWDLLGKLQAKIPALAYLQDISAPTRIIFDPERRQGCFSIFHTRRSAQITRSWVSHNPSTIVRILHKFVELTISSNRFACQDPRDRVLAILGFVPDADTLCALYQNATSHVTLYARFCELLLFSHDDQELQRVVLITLLSWAAGFSRTSGLPSWVPNFQGFDRFTYSPLLQDATYQKGRRDFSVRQVGKPDQISLRALVFDVVRETFPTVPTTLGNAQLKYLDIILKVGEWESLLAESVLGQTRGMQTQLSATEVGVGKMNVEAYWKTLLAVQFSCKVPEILAQRPDFACFRQLVAAIKELDWRNAENPITEANSFFMPGMDFFHLMQKRLTGRKLFMTSGGRFGHGSTDVCPGDILCSFNGCSAPFILRRVTDRDEEVYHLISSAYVHDMMNGEVEDLDLEEQEITLC